jgi:lipopolysaccharide transport system permease protein
MSIIVNPSYREKLDWRMFAAYHELFFVLTWRDIVVKYKQTAFGFAWAILRPLLTIIVFTVVFGKLANVPSIGNVPYALVVCTGLLPWYLMSLSLADASNSLIGNSAIISKVYFPRLILPISTLLVNFVDFLISLSILFGLSFWYGFVPSWKIVFLPFVISLAMLVILGPGLLFAALNVKFRDFRYVVPFVMQLGLYISPVGFSSSIVPERWHIIYSLNPAAGVIEAFRWCFLGGQPIYWPSIFFSISISLILLWIGISTFRRTEKIFTDVI